MANLENSVKDFHNENQTNESYREGLKQTLNFYEGSGFNT